MRTIFKLKNGSRAIWSENDQRSVIPIPAVPWSLLYGEILMRTHLSRFAVDRSRTKCPAADFQLEEASYYRASPFRQTYRLMQTRQNRVQKILASRFYANLPHSGGPEGDKHRAKATRLRPWRPIVQRLNCPAGK